MSTIYKLFPMPVKRVTYDKHDELKKFITEKVMPDPNVPVNKNKSGTVSLYQTFDDKCFFSMCREAPVIEFEEWCKKEILLYARDSMAFDMDNIMIVGSWINVYGSSGQDLHSHANSFFSCNYYLNYDEEAGHTPLRLWSPYKTMNPARPYLLHNRLKQNIQPDNYDFADMTAKEGEMYIWPSFMSHSVESTPKNALRQTISMNAMPTKIMMHSYSFEVKKG